MSPVSKKHPARGAAPGDATSARAAKSPRRRRPASGDERHHRIAEAAYYRAERRGFDGGDPVRDWLEAEAEVDGSKSTRSRRKP
ncbi:MAG TPA: DUF2934 domain-containing protein [Gammaproteobacteria bacterium]|nr:DUF2934 domain-containing protein [Gammaproteobacteria bacterium]